MQASFAHMEFITIELQQEGEATKRTSLSSSGDEKLIEGYSFTTLGHELIHASHDNIAITTKSKTTLNSQYTNLEEQETITGLSQPLSFVEISPQEVEELKTREDVDDLFAISNNSTYQRLNENALRSEFGLPFRSTHNAYLLPKSYHLDTLEIPNDLWQFCLNSILNGRKQDIIDFFEVNTDVDLAAIKTTNGDSFLESFLTGILEYDLLSAFKVVHKCNLKLKFSSSLSLILAKRQSGKILDYYLEKNPNEKTVTDDTSFNNLFHTLFDIKNRGNPLLNINPAPPKMDLEEVTKILLKHGIDFDAQNIDGDTPLHIAFRNGGMDLEDVSTLLIDAGAKLNVQNNLGVTPLYEAFARKASLFILKALLTHGADPSIVPQGSEPVIFQVLNEKRRTDLFELLSQFSIDFAVKNAKGQNILHLISSMDEEPQEKMKLFEFFIKKGVPIDVKDVDGKTYRDYFEIWAKDYLNKYPYETSVEVIEKMRNQLPES